MMDMSEAKRQLVEKGFEIGVCSDLQGVYYTAIHRGELVYADIREAYSLNTLRDMYIECFEHLKVLGE